MVTAAQQSSLYTLVSCYIHGEYLNFRVITKMGNEASQSAIRAAARAGLADCYAAMGELEKAAMEMQRALPSDIDGSLHYRLGRWYRKLGREREAAEAYSQTARLKDEKRKSELMGFTLTLEK